MYDFSAFVYVHLTHSSCLEFEETHFKIEEEQCTI